MPFAPGGTEGGRHRRPATPEQEGKGRWGSMISKSIWSHPVPRQDLCELRTSPTGMVPSQSPGGEPTGCAPSLKRPPCAWALTPQSLGRHAGPGPSCPSEDSLVLKLLGCGPGPSTVDLGSHIFSDFECFPEHLDLNIFIRCHAYICLTSN